MFDFSQQFSRHGDGEVAIAGGAHHEVAGTDGHMLAIVNVEPRFIVQNRQAIDGDPQRQGD